MSRTARGVPPWAIYATWLLSFIGLGIAIYMTISHFSGNHYLGCSTTGTVDCAAVTTSAQSYFLGIPVAVLGLADFVVMVVINSPWLWHAKNYWIHIVRFILGIGSMVFVLWLVAAELLIIDHICLWCTGVHVVTFLLLIVMSLVCPAQLGWTRSVAE